MKIKQKVHQLIEVKAKQPADEVFVNNEMKIIDQDKLDS